MKKNVIENYIPNRLEYLIHRTNAFFLELNRKRDLLNAMMFVTFKGCDTPEKYWNKAQELREIWYKEIGRTLPSDKPKSPKIKNSKITIQMTQTTPQQASIYSQNTQVSFEAAPQKIDVHPVQSSDFEPGIQLKKFSEDREDQDILNKKIQTPYGEFSINEIRSVMGKEQRKLTSAELDLILWWQKKKDFYLKGIKI